LTESEPKGPPPGSLPFDPEEGFGPQVGKAFLDHYGADSVFVTAAVDLLSWQITHVLIRAGNLGPDFEPVAHGTPRMRLALAELLDLLGERGMERPSAKLMRSVAGIESPISFEEAAGHLAGAGTMDRWMAALEAEDFDRASGALGPQ
jgi:hypothetical protein